MNYLHDMANRRDQVAALDRVLELAVLIDADMNRGLAERGLTPARAHLVWELAQRGPSTQRELADALRVSPRNVTGLVDALVETGFVSRKAHPTDRRAVLVEFTARGAEVTRRLEGEQREFARMLFEDMSQSQLDGFLAGVDSVLDRLRPLVPLDDREVDHA